MGNNISNMEDKSDMESPCKRSCSQDYSIEAQVAVRGPPACSAAPATTSAGIAAEAAMQPIPVAAAKAQAPSPTSAWTGTREIPAPCSHGCFQQRQDEAQLAVRGPPACSAAPATNSTAYPLAAEAAMQTMPQVADFTRAVTWEIPAPLDVCRRQQPCDAPQVAVRGPPTCSAAPATNTAVSSATEAAMRPMPKAQFFTRASLSANYCSNCRFAQEQLAVAKEKLIEQEAGIEQLKKKLKLERDFIKKLKYQIKIIKYNRRN
ncbi:uncharacterized protein LOC116417804 [Nasonia vitripennis]|uniref:Uncharacterized protein n=1 Tax=Nasonia vitripennis TaxID=7425 RepID=A0A7M7QJI7_NASVI|nr:uncharacterized protein LOC116417804 [Nasonia vitripennis]